jgi:hypothetical protein
MTEDEFLNILTQTQWPADLSEEEEEDDGTEDEAGLAHFLETGRLKPEVVRAMLDRFQPGEEDLKREVQAILDEYENKKKQK